MNKKLSIVAFIAFSIAWIFDLLTDIDQSCIINTGLMWLALAAIVGRDSK